MRGKLQKHVRMCDVLSKVEDTGCGDKHSARKTVFFFYIAMSETTATKTKKKTATHRNIINFSLITS